MKNVFYMKLLIVLLVNIHCFAQTSLKDCLGKSIEIIDTSSQLSLQSLDKYISGKRIIVLSEENHGDGTMIDIQNKIVSYLHEKHNFDLYLDEGCFFASKIGFDTLLNRNDAFSAYCYANARGRCKYDLSEFKTWEYAKNQIEIQDTLVLGSLDFAFSTPNSIFYLKDLIKNIFKSYDSTFLVSKEWNCFESTLPGYSQNRDTLHVFHHRADTNCIRKVLKELMNLPNFQDKSFWKQTMENYIIVSNIYSIIEKMPKSKQKLDYDRKIHEKWHLNLYQARDIQMFKNLQWYLTKYPNKKVIIRVSSAHSMRNSFMHLWATSPEVNNVPVTLGDYIFKNYPDQAYSIAFLSHQGVRGEIERFNSHLKDVPKRKSSSLEAVMHKAGIKNCFLDLKKMEDNCLSDFDKSYYMTPTVYRNTKRKWSNNYNGIFFIDTMYPCRIGINSELFDIFFEVKWMD